MIYLFDIQIADIYSPMDIKCQVLNFRYFYFIFISTFHVSSNHRSNHQHGYGKINAINWTIYLSDNHDTIVFVQKK